VAAGQGLARSPGFSGAGADPLDLPAGGGRRPGGAAVVVERDALARSPGWPAVLPSSTEPDRLDGIDGVDGEASRPVWSPCGRPCGAGDDQLVAAHHRRDRSRLKAVSVDGSAGVDAFAEPSVQMNVRGFADHGTEQPRLGPRPGTSIRVSPVPRSATGHARWPRGERDRFLSTATPCVIGEGGGARELDRARAGDRGPRVVGEDARATTKATHAAE